MDLNDLLLTALRATAVYLFVLFVIRMLGKREVGAITAFDFLVALMIGEVVDEIVFGDVSLVKGFVAVGAVAFWHLVNSWASYKSKFIDRLTGSEPIVLVENGQIQQRALTKERMLRRYESAQNLGAHPCHSDAAAEESLCPINARSPSGAEAGFARNGSWLAWPHPARPRSCLGPDAAYA